MNFFHKKKLYVPALSIVALVISLLLVIGISTYRNIDREKKTQLNFIYRQGLILLRAIEAGARSGMVMPMWGGDSVARLLHETGKDESIAYIYLVDAQGLVLHHSMPSLRGSKAIWLPQINDRDDVVAKIRNKSDGSQIYDLARIFSPKFQEIPESIPHNPTQSHAHRDAVIVIGINMQDFEAARKADIQHAFVMAAIVLALGSGTIFFIFVIQNYYLVDSTLKRTEDYTRQVIANMANGLLGLDKNGKLVSYNAVALDLLAMEEANLKNIDVEDVIDFNATGIRDTLKSCRKVMDKEFIFRTHSGETTPLSISSTPIEPEPGVCGGAVIIIRDLREIKALEEKIRVSEKLAAVGKLAASVAHEVRNPLSSVKGLAQHMSNSMGEGTKQKEYAQIMVKEVDRINRVINDLLTFSRPVQLELEPTDVPKLIHHVVNLVSADANARNITIQIHCEPSITVVPLDENQMAQVLLNLLLNAVSAIHKNGVIDIYVRKDSEDRELIFEIADDGDGIPPDMIQTIFDPFVTHREKGTGIGLSIVKKIVENHNGKIEVVSPPATKSVGSVFRLFIPVNTNLLDRKN
jgi:two-component system, NtrC family, sensor histidine kinase HydH